MGGNESRLQYEHMLSSWTQLGGLRDRLVRQAFAAGVTKSRIHLITGIARSTIDRILSPKEKPSMPAPVPPMPGIPPEVACPFCGGYVRGHQFIGTITCSVIEIFSEPVRVPREALVVDGCGNPSCDVPWHQPRLH